MMGKTNHCAGFSNHQRIALPRGSGKKVNTWQSTKLAQFDDYICAASWIRRDRDALLAGQSQMDKAGFDHSSLFQKVKPNETRSVRFSRDGQDFCATFDSQI